MKPCTILSPIELCSRREVELIIRSFVELHDSVTNKHRRHLKLVLFTQRQAFLTELSLIGEKRLSKHIEIVKTKGRQKEYFSNASILFLCSSVNARAYIAEALSNGMPVLGFDGFVERQYIDNTCGRLIQKLSPEHNISDFASFLRMLYFDPEARKILEKGALMRYKLLFSVSRQEKEPALVSIA